MNSCRIRPMVCTAMSVLSCRYGTMRTSCASENGSDAPAGMRVVHVMSSSGCRLRYSLSTAAIRSAGRSESGHSGDVTDRYMRMMALMMVSVLATTATRFPVRASSLKSGRTATRSVSICFVHLMLGRGSTPARIIVCTVYTMLCIQCMSPTNASRRSFVVLFSTRALCWCTVVCVRCAIRQGKTKKRDRIAL